MQTPFSTRTIRNSLPNETNWCCGCGKLLGKRRAERLHIRLGRQHEYIVSLPVTATCRGCGALNELRSAR